ncbi:MAG: TonB-dependent receptor [Bacteroidaceae bacterium]|nr:TonB-dependent receptor [Bacteroidaceae bacterium]
MEKRLWSLLAVCLMTVSMAFAQHSVSGKVIDKSTGEPVIGASVLVKGTTIGAATDLDGKFTINNVPQHGAVLQVTYVGMLPTEVAAKNGIRILMEPSEKSIDEVMVVAYGTMKKSSFTGSAAEVKAEDIENHIATNVTSALAATTAGVQMTSNNGDPASEGQAILIRGISSIYASREPLIILDGMPYDGVLSNINPQDVESMTVLKDAAASAIYGARGANGVILINTKKGRPQDAEIHFDAKWGSNSRCVPQYDVIDDPAEYYETAYRQLYNDYVYNGYSQAYAYRMANARLLDENNGGLGYLVYTLPEGENLIGTNFKLNPNATLGYSDGQYYYTPDDWYKETIHNSFRQEYNLSISGANDRFNYYASVGFLDQNGIVDQSGYKRYTGHSNVDYQVKKWFKVGAQLNFTHADFEQPDYSTTSWASSGNLFYLVNNMAPIYPLYVRNADGSIAHDANGLTKYDSGQTNQHRPSTVGNPVRDNQYDRSQNYRDMFTGNWSAIFTPIDGLTLTARIGVNSDNRRRNNLYSAFGNAASTDGATDVTSVRQFSVNNQYLGNYATDFGTDETHNLDVLVGYEQYKYKYQYSYTYRTNLYDPLIGELGNAYGDKSLIDANSYTNNYMIEGIFGRAQYDYKEKYFVSTSLRRDASSRFAKGHRWGSFYSFGAAWNIAKEDFMKEYTWIDLLKLKASYGEQGNDNLSEADYPYFPYANIYGITYDPDNNAYSKTLKQLGNDDLTWEKNRNFNVGVDFGFWKNRLSGSLEFFTRTTSDMLFYLNQPASSGYGSLQKPINVGSVRNLGFELQLNGTPIRQKNFTWDINFNLTHYKNTIRSLHESVAEDGIKGSYYIRRIGGSLYQAYVYKYAGVYSANNYPEGSTYDASNDGRALYYYQKTNTKLDDAGNPVLDADGNPVTYETKEKTLNFSDATQYDDGDILPKLQGGIGMSFKVYDFDLSFQCGWQLGGRFYDATYQSLMHTSDQSIGSAWHKDALKAWSVDNQGSNIPRLENDYSVGQSAVDRFYTSSDYFSLSNFTVGYTLPKLITSRIGIESLRVYVAGENMFVLSARKGLDPRWSLGLGSYTGGTGYASGNYSAMRTVTAGISLSF